MAVSFSAKNQGFTCFWEIENIVLCESEKDLELISQTFSVSVMNRSRWYLKLKQDQNGYVVLMIFKADVPRGPITMHFHISLLTNCGWQNEKECKDQTFISGGNGYGLPLIESKFLFSQKDKYILDGSLIIGCHMWNDTIKNKSVQSFLRSRIKVNNEVQHFPKQHFHGIENNTWRIIYKYFNPVGNSYLQLKSAELSKKLVENKDTQTVSKEIENTLNYPKDLLKFFAEKEFSYVTLRTPSKEFAVHKALLCATSPVFRAMFDKDMKENQIKIVDIDDIDNDTLTLLLQFLHTKSLGDLDWTMSTKLYDAADKYQIQQLKSECHALLKSKLTLKNVCELLVLSDTHHDTEMKRCAQDYFCNHSKAILRTGEWKDLLLNRTELACEILRIYAERS